MSYYTKGALVALCFDLTLRAEGKGYARRRDARAVEAERRRARSSEADFAAALEAVGGRSFAQEIAQLGALDRRAAAGRAAAQRTAWPRSTTRRSAHRSSGLRVAEANGSVQVKMVLRGGAAEQAGFSANDEWIGIELPARPRASRRRAGASPSSTTWRSTWAPLKKITALVARDRRLLRLPLTLPSGVTTWRLAAQDPAKLARWLDPQ